MNPFDMQFDLHLFLSTATVIGKNKSRGVSIDSGTHPATNNFSRIYLQYLDGKMDGQETDLGGKWPRRNTPVRIYFDVYKKNELAKI